ncbi:MAG: hypothetical protein HPY50_11670 [Firmicutes bacterium]|nr:hypothetical protein [Bacillota bacterium]
MIKRKSKKILSGFLAIAFMAALFPIITTPARAADVSGSWSDYAASEPANDGTTYTVTSPEELAWVAAQVNSYINNFTDCTIELGGDIDLSAHYWAPIGSDPTQFRGDFDGNGYTISGLTILDTMKYAGLFGQVYNGTIQDVNLTGVSIESTYNAEHGYAGGIAGYSKDSITDCSVTGDVSLSSSNFYAFCGGLVGKEEDGSIEGCSVSGQVTASMDQMETYCGGLVGDIINGSVSDCDSSAAVGTSASYLGGLAGMLNNTSVTDSRSTGTVENEYASGFTGGFAGRAGSDPGYSIEDSDASGNVTQSSTNGSVGGFIGFCAGYTVSGCHATGNISGGTDTGGFIGSNSSAVTGCYATGSVTASDNITDGGFVGYNAGAVMNCYSTGAVSVSGGSMAGGFAGQAASFGSILACYSTGTVSGGYYSGGFAGSSGGTVGDCYSTGTVTGGTYAGGFVGTNNTTVANCYSAGAVSGETYTGGFVGWEHDSETNSYWLSGTAADAAGDGTATAAAIDGADMSDASFSVTLNSGRTPAPWITVSGVNSGYPVLIGVGDGVVVCTISGTVTLPDGTTPAPGVTLKLYDFNFASGELTYLATTTADGDGNYSLTVEIADSNSYFYSIYASSYTTGGKTYSDSVGSALVSLSTGTTYEADISLVDLSDSWLGHAQTPDGYTPGDDEIYIDTPEELAWLSLQSILNFDGFEDVTIYLEDDLDLSGYNWFPICSSIPPFAGTFIGNGHVIANLSADVSYDTSDSSIYSQWNAGLFGKIDGGTVTDLGLTDVSVTLDSNAIGSSDQGAGALAGYSAGADIERCYSTGSVSSYVSGSYAGGLIGQAYNSEISECYSECDVSGTYDHGAPASGFGGGLLGYFGVDVGIAPTVTDCYATGSVTGTCTYNGGFVGCYFGEVTIANCYAIGSVSGATYNGSLAGEGQCTGSISNIYWLEREGLPGVADGGAGDLALNDLDLGKSSGDMTLQAFADTLNSDTDMTDPWMWDPEINGGYPVLDGVGVGGLVIPPAVISLAAIGGVTAPARDAAPMTEITETAQYTGAVTWSPADNPFAASTVYTATITLTPKTGYTLNGVAANFFTVAGATATNAADSGVITAVFPATEAAPPAFVAVTGITDVPTAATAGVDLTLAGTVAPANATNQTIVWSVKSAGTTGAAISGNTLSTTAAGTVTVTATITNGLTESTDYTQDFDITVSAAPVVDATISPDSGSFDKKTDSQADVQTAVTWGSATGISDVKAGGISIGAGNYTVSDDTLTIKKEYLAAQTTGSLVLTVEFNAGAAATLTISITDADYQHHRHHAAHHQPHIPQLRLKCPC